MTLPNRTIAIITDELHVALRRGTADILIVGGLLAEAKVKIAHGQWLLWLKNEFSMSERSAQKYTKAAAYAVKYEPGADLKLSPTALFLLSRYDQREIAEAVTEAAKERHVGCDQVKKIVQDVTDRGKSTAGSTNGALLSGKSRSRANSRDELVFSFTAAFIGLHRLTKSRETARFTKCKVKADDLAQLGQLLTELANLKAQHAGLEVSIGPVVRHEHV
jgi:hypothetical protein